MFFYEVGVKKILEIMNKINNLRLKVGEEHTRQSSEIIENSKDLSEEDTLKLFKSVVRATRSPLRRN